MPIFNKNGPNNVAININKYIAKYDFDIARKIKPSGDTTLEYDSDEEPRDEKKVRKQFTKNAILEIL